MSKFIDWLAATFYTSDEEIQTHKDVAAAQQAIADRQLAEGNRTLTDYWSLSDDIGAAGNYQANFKDKNSGIFATIKLVPWWAWVGIVLFVAWEMGGLKWVLRKARGALKL